ncbi:uncharacterized protein LOC124115550 [Haliotis rufescens]|uniref:uncharacterized protein LOC124115550 n=1 Tax=Haliotis rufescens TaxID=6454 RepID=UPI001EB02ABB|nr:uncharacterized protein LOC124115550 [Haliotis rufescens]
MLYIVLVTVLLAADSGVECTSCPDCENTFNSAKDLKNVPGSCMSWKAYLTCLETATDNCPQGSGQVEEIGNFYDLISHNCSLTDACVCQKGYWETHLTSTDNANCNAAKTRISCLRGKTELACDDTTSVAGLATSTETFIGSFSTCSIDAGSACECELNYVKADVSSESMLCTETKQFISCLAGLPGTVCMTTTVAEAVVAAETTISNIPGNICAVKETACACEIAYAKSDIGDDTKKCSETKVFIGCLRGTTGTGCTGTEIVQLITGAETKLTGIPDSACALGNTACGCEVTYAKADVTSPASLCTETKAFIACLAGKRDRGCNMSVSVEKLATEGETILKGIGTECNITETACACEIAYAKADVSDDTKLCTETKKYIGCLKGKTGTGCDGSSSINKIVTVAETTLGNITGGVCSLANTPCGCETDFAKADVSNSDKLCNETKAFISCLAGKSQTGCDGMTSVAQLATSAQAALATTSCSFPDGSACACELNYTKADMSTSSLKCTALRDFLGCLIGTSGTGCDGSTTLRTLASNIDTSMTALGDTDCPSKSNCACQIAYITADISDNSKKCTEVKKLTSCFLASVANGCGSATTQTYIGKIVESTFTDIGPSDCPVTSTCQCEINFNKADISDRSTTCKSLKELLRCLEAVTETTDPVCDGSKLKEDLLTASMSSHLDLCSSGGSTDSSILSLLLLTIASKLLLPQLHE